MEKHLSKILEISRALMPKKFDFYHISFIFDKGKIITVGINNRRKTHPRTLDYKYIGREGENISNKVSIHSEMSACLRMGLDSNFKKLKIVNVRIKKSGVIGNSRPCSGCLHLINQLGFKEIWYTTSEGSLVKL